jgi:H/ACA ribonucleoprotein complex subunit 3
MFYHKEGFPEEDEVVICTVTSVQYKCPSCGSYSLTESCACGSMRVSPKPPKYSPEDKYGRYRRQYKEEHATS